MKNDPEPVERLPHRLLCAGEFISIQLVGLQVNRGLIGYRSPESILLMVAFGRVQIHTDGSRLVLNEAEALQLNPLCEYDITTDQVADLLLITMPNKVQPFEDVRALQESCRFHSIELPKPLRSDDFLKSVGLLAPSAACKLPSINGNRPGAQAEQSC